MEDVRFYSFDYSSSKGLYLINSTSFSTLDPYILNFGIAFPQKYPSDCHVRPMRIVLQTFLFLNISDFSLFLM